MSLTLIDLFADSTHLADLQASITPETELSQVLLETQGTVNAFISAIGTHVRSDVVADTFMMFGEVFSTDQVKYFSVCAILHNKTTGVQTSVVFPFVFLMVDTKDLKAGLYFNLASALKSSDE